MQRNHPFLFLNLRFRKISDWILKVDLFWGESGPGMTLWAPRFWPQQHVVRSTPSLFSTCTSSHWTFLPADLHEVSKWDVHRFKRPKRSIKLINCVKACVNRISTDSACPAGHSSISVSSYKHLELIVLQCSRDKMCIPNCLDCEDNHSSALSFTSKLLLSMSVDWLCSKGRGYIVFQFLCDIK